MSYALPALVTCLVLILMIVLAAKVGMARQKHKIFAPAISGNADFERVFRVHMNTLENLVVFLPAMWMFAYFVSPVWAAGLGAVWIIGRIIYALSYYRDVNKRGPGFLTNFLVQLVLIVGSLYVIVSNLLQASM